MALFKCQSFVYEWTYEVYHPIDAEGINAWTTIYRTPPNGTRTKVLNQGGSYTDDNIDLSDGTSSRCNITFYHKASEGTTTYAKNQNISIGYTSYSGREENPRTFIVYSNRKS